MASSRASRRQLAITRRQHRTRRDLFLCEARNGLPRVALGGETEWQARGRSIELSREADRWLAANGYDQWGRQAKTAGPGRRHHRS